MLQVVPPSSLYSILVPAGSLVTLTEIVWGWPSYVPEKPVAVMSSNGWPPTMVQQVLTVPV